MGQGHTAMETFFREMNIEVATCYTDGAGESMQQAIDKIQGDIDGDICDFAVSCDGTWQRRGYASLNGLVTVIVVDTGEVIDYVVLNNKCAQCIRGKAEKEQRTMMNSRPPTKANVQLIMKVLLLQWNLKELLLVLNGPLISINQDILNILVMGTPNRISRL